MLKLLRYGIDATPGMEWDVEKVFYRTKMTGCEAERQFIELLDRGEYVSTKEFRNRYGEVWNTDKLSTGCKAAIAVYHNPNEICNGIELGINALSMIIAYCKDGCVSIYDYYHDFDNLDIEDIDVWYNGYRFTSFRRFQYFHDWEWPNPPAFEGDEGQEHGVERWPFEHETAV